MPHVLHPQNGIFRALAISVRPQGQLQWKRIRGDESFTELAHGVPYELRVDHPAVIGRGIGGEPIMTPDQYLPVHD